MLARLRPGKKGFPVLRHMYKGSLYEARKGWYEVTPVMARKLEKLHVDPRDEESPLMFNVATVEEAQEIDANERKKVERATPERPNRQTTVTKQGRQRGVVTTRDLPQDEPDDEDEVEAESDEPAMLDPDPDGDELKEPEAVEEGLVPVGRVAAPTPKPESSKPSKPQVAPKESKPESKGRARGSKPPQKA
jgi:hypothetical protein